MWGDVGRCGEMALRVREGLDAKFDRPLTKGLSNRL